jgi:Ca-activated chloride channel family protein
VTFAYPELLWLLPIALVLLAIMLSGDVARRKATQRLGTPSMIDALVTFDAGPRRAMKGAVRILAVVLAIVAVARPRYGRGTKIVPAADVSSMVVLDVSKSMYAQDVLPSRLERARSDVARMMTTLPQIRWGGVAFAGEAVAYPPSTDASETAQFLRSHEPYEMPGGTAIAKALELARRQLIPEDSSGNPVQGKPTRRQRPVIVLVTDGEDLEGDPVAVARACRDEGIQIHVVMIGGRAPQPIPDVNPETGVAKGYIRDEQGQLVTTELSPEAEEQLQSIAAETKGIFVRASDGSTGIAKIEAELKRLIASEGGEKVETLYADQYAIPLGLAMALLIIDVFIGEARRRKRMPPEPALPPAQQRRHSHAR